MNRGQFTIQYIASNNEKVSFTGGVPECCEFVGNTATCGC